MAIQASALARLNERTLETKFRLIADNVLANEHASTPEYPHVLLIEARKPIENEVSS